MRSRIYRMTHWGLALIMTAALFAPLGSSQKAQAAMPAFGIVCANGAYDSGTNTRHFDLKATAGYISMPDGNLVYMWSYAENLIDSVEFQYPGPVLCANEGETVSVTLTNTLNLLKAHNVNTSIMFPGQDEVTVGGVLAQPEFDGLGNLTSLTNSAAPGGSITYEFTASHPGTFVYESGTDYEVQTQMGLVGALVIRPALGVNYAYDNAGSQWIAGEEFMEMITEVDSDIHLAVERMERPKMAMYRTRYWMLNGRAYPDTIAPNGASWLPHQPYSALSVVTAKRVGDTTPPALVRYINLGRNPHPFHPHGENGRVIGLDGRPLESATAQDLSYERFLFDLNPGQTMDTTWKFTDVEQWSPQNPVPGYEYQQQNLVRGELFGSPYLGQAGSPMTGEANFNVCGEFYHIWHSHAVFEVSAYGLPMGGMVTVVLIAPPKPNNCPF